MIQSRQQLRSTFAAKRRKISPDQQLLLGKQLAEHLLSSAVFHQSYSIGCYVPSAGEIDPTPIIEAVWKLGKTCYLPALDPLKPSYLRFIQYSQGDSLVLNQYQILEPPISANSRAKTIAVAQLDLVLVPLLACDAKGNRLGRGAGYYDHTFGFLNVQNRPAKPYLLGLAYEWQFLEQIPCETWDVSLNGVATELGIKEKK